ncbi:MAG: hypothetical protein Tsb0033_15950 [Winogradskyella sp.]
MRKLLVLLWVISSYNCKSISVANETQTKTSQYIELVTIGEDKLFLLEEDYNATAIPSINEPVKVSASVLEFNKASYKTFLKANNKKRLPLTINYVDSLDSKHRFLKLELADRVSILNALNNKENNVVKDYIQNKKDAHIISAISIAFDEEKTKSILDADALFLEQEPNKTFVLRAYKNNSVLGSYKFNEGVVFAYQASNFCWKENDKYKLNIVDIVETTDKCPNSTYRSAKRAKKKIDYFKL